MQTALTWLGANGPPVRSVLDVGASDGRWSRDCMQAYPDAHYVLYEPNAVHFGGIARLQAEHGTHVTHEPVAVGAEVGTAAFDVGDAFGGGLVDASTDASVVEQVPIVSLDESVERLGLEGPFLVKLDTHGYERSILGGARAVLDQASVLVIEAYAYRISSEALLFWELCALLDEQGFRALDLVDVMHREHDGALWQMDLVFLRDSWPGFSHSRYR